MQTRVSKVVLPRGLRAPDAAHYIGLSKSKFLDLVHEGILPQPVYIGRCALWDRLDLDAAFENFEPKVADNPWDS